MSRPTRTRMVNADRELIADYKRQHASPGKQFRNPYKRSQVNA